MTDYNTITLPDAETMMERLREVSADKQRVSLFYPLLIKHVGERWLHVDVINLLLHAAREYIAHGGVIEPSALHEEMARYLDALITTEPAATEAQAFWAEARRSFEAEAAR